MMNTSVKNRSTEDLVVRRTPWDIILGLLIIASSLVLLGNVVWATALSVFFVGWMSLVSGVALLIGALFRIKSGGFWSGALGAAVLIVIGIYMLRNPLIGAIALTLMVGSMFLASGIARVVGAIQASEVRWLLVVSGIISAGLGLWVMFNVLAATPQLLGTILAIQILFEGITLIMVGRLRRPAEKKTQKK
ncbi:MAG TPA: DUF308 domain-containing protein [Actinomycetaceae bacterium]|nr:DUF308 domain-containing protein [Actinomycetaceae bacterium]